MSCPSIEADVILTFDPLLSIVTSRYKAFDGVLLLLLLLRVIPDAAKLVYRFADPTVVTPPVEAKAPNRLKAKPTTIRAITTLATTSIRAVTAPLRPLMLGQVYVKLHIYINFSPSRAADKPGVKPPVLRR